jgi:DNA-directed RNA polymerase subunit M/transcription elongation factor TFIIS
MSETPAMTCSHACRHEAKDWPCKHCGAKHVWFKSKETWDGANDVFDYHCHACGKEWRVYTDYC